MEQLTVQQLCNHLKMLLTNHPEIANKKIVISDDNEGNGYHGLFYGVTFNEKQIKEVVECSNGVYDSQSDNPTEIVLLG